LIDLNSKNIENVLPRDQSSVTCIKEEKKCLIGSGQLLEGGTVDQWIFYNIGKDSFTILNPENKPTNIQYISPDVVETWESNRDNGYKVIDNGPILLTGGDNASHVLLSSDTIRYLAEFNYDDTIEFIEYPTDDLFTIKGQLLRNIPKFINNDDNLIENIDDNCDYFVEFGGKEQNPQVPFHYINEVVLYKICNQLNE